MPLGTIDRRVARTRTLLHNALLSLLRSKDYEAITVEDLCAKAKIGRSTFYAHYASKDELLRAQLDAMHDTLRARRRAAAAALPARQGLLFSRIMLEHAREHAHLHRHLLGNRGGGIVFAKIRGILVDLVRDETAALPAGDATRHAFAVEYVVGAFSSVLNWWLDHGATLAPQRVDALFQRATAEGIAALERE